MFSFDNHHEEYDSVDVLAHILTKCAALGYDCGYTKAQKLLYCCYGVVLAVYNKRLTKEHPKCWQYGPAFPRAFNAHHKGRIDYTKDPFTHVCSLQDPLYDFVETIDSTIEYYGKYTAGQLVEWSHRPSSPWALCSANGQCLYGDVGDTVIRSFFRERILKTQLQNENKN